MHIIFGEENANQFLDKHTVLELDSFRMKDSDEIATAYCVVEKISLTELPMVDRQRTMHGHLIQNFRKKNWTFCEEAITHLLGKWQTEVDSFYLDLLGRIKQYKENDPGPDWDGILEK
jgi:hypothetical protein